ncbi:MAG: hypothetical protein ACLTR6_06260 [Clostridium fessum]
MQQENMKTLESLEDFRHFSEKELEIRFDQLKKQIVPADKTIREQAEKHWGMWQNRLRQSGSPGGRYCAGGGSARGGSARLLQACAFNFLCR